MTNQILNANTQKGENIFHCWNANESFWIHTSRGAKGVNEAYQKLGRKKSGAVYLSTSFSAIKSKIKYFF